ncbi:MAG: sugar transferase [Ilumatobacter sp.]|nr:sugar transferase [Ilumatobacter sp.]
MDRVDRADRHPAQPADVDAIVAHLPLRTVRMPRTPYTLTVKPILDRVAAILAIALAAIPMLLIAGAVALLLGRPVLFRQRRVGQHGTSFEVLKFRTMRPDRRGQRLAVIHDRRRTHKTPLDPRHTAFGQFLRRYSLDELPQLFNVLRGEMSFVGPRPELHAVVDEQYQPGLEQRHHVKPGLTGLWQISARSDGPMHENGEWDLAYVEQVSAWTDLRILLRTPAAMFLRERGA